MIAAIVYTKFGPYHLPRLERSGALGAALGHRLVGIEIADTQRDYRWPEAPGVGQHYTRLTLFPGREYWSLPYRSIRRALEVALDGCRPDVVVLPGWGLRGAQAGLGWCLRNRVPRVVISDSQPEDHPQTRLKHWLKRLLVQRYQAGFVAGQPHMRYLAALGLPPERCFSGCDVVDNAFFASATAGPRHFAPDGASVLLSCLRLLPRKNVLAVLDALATRPSWHWVLVGDGPQRPAVEQRINQLGLRRRVKLPGHVDYLQIPSFYNRADVYLQPSLSEPWGLAVNEAMASGLPVVVSNRCGCREDLVHDGVNGLIFDPASPESIVPTLDRLLNLRPRWREMGRASQEIIARWGLDLFASHLWSACEAARRHAAETTRTPLLNAILSRALAR